MPNRMLRDWTNSDKVDLLSAQAEAFFTRLIMKADDYGCFWADAKRLKANLFPLKSDTIRETDLLRWMTECQKAGLIVIYDSGGKKYLQIIEFGQRLRAKKNKFPMPVSNPRSDVGHSPPEEEVEEEHEVEVEGEGNDNTPPAESGVVYYSIEKIVLENQILFEKILMATGADPEVAKVSLRKYHLFLEEKEQYPKSKRALLAGFEKWLMNEKKFSGNGHSADKKSSKHRGAHQLVESLKRDFIAGGKKDP